ncbi:ribosome biogenesis domain-containing protein [Rubinisphaera italica]|uniref:16S/18S rRNA aminocarboxypropyltransferase Tsr3 C-terminal domain-containing protein n=1 Tax=Rubinisphaera italica TaxID=2527969 RepID=A0A5C5XKS1_9PLAN|nr:DUF367 domain-containing protein [Rubinisphaera italica]TWT63139.1 hypothetical protein Pan54_38910 [Rubinisphaera italica]
MSLPSHPTIIVVHYKERRSKCTVEPLRHQPGFEFWKFPLKEPQALPNYIRLGIDGPPLSREDRKHGLLVLDATWKLASKMEAEFEDVPIRSLPVCQTAYPRNSKLFEDPSAGLATIEAIYVAYKILGYSLDGLLDEYRWQDEFLRINEDVLNAI